MVLLQRFQTPGTPPMRVYCELQRCLMRRYVARGGTEQEWCERLAVTFRKRWGWILTVHAG